MPVTRRLRVTLILPALTEATRLDWRPIRCALFPPLGLATLATYLDPDDEAVIVDEHVEPLPIDDTPDVAVIQVYITNAKRAYALADAYRARGVFVALGGLHVTSRPAEAAAHADAIFMGPGELAFPAVLADFRVGMPRRVLSQVTSQGYASDGTSSVSTVPRDSSQARIAADAMRREASSVTP
jgi:radical SAM superfamily enzyme YgiQ (UPF0313 family)